MNCGSGGLSFDFVLVDVDLQIGLFWVVLELCVDIVVGWNDLQVFVVCIFDQVLYYCIGCVCVVYGGWGIGMIGDDDFWFI